MAASQKEPLASTGRHPGLAFLGLLARFIVRRRGPRRHDQNPWRFFRSILSAVLIAGLTFQVACGRPSRTSGTDDAATQADGLADASTPAAAGPTEEPAAACADGKNCPDIAQGPSNEATTIVKLITDHPEEWTYGGDTLDNAIRGIHIHRMDEGVGPVFAIYLGETPVPGFFGDLHNTTPTVNDFAVEAAYQAWRRNTESARASALAAVAGQNDSSTRP